jgi:hypothetical protein
MLLSSTVHGRGNAPGFVAGEQIGGRATAGLRLVLERAADTDQRSTAGDSLEAASTISRL